MVIDSIDEPIVVLGPQGRIVHVNPAARTLIGVGPDAVGRNASEVLPWWAQVQGYEPNAERGVDVEVAREEGGAQRTFEMRVSKLSASDVYAAGGRVIVLRDVTASRQEEQARHKQLELYQALRDTAAALNSTLDLEQLLKRVIENVARVVPHDATNIILFDDAWNITSTVRSAHYKEIRDYDIDTILGENVNVHPPMIEMIKTGQPRIIPDTRESLDWRVFPETAWIRSYAGVPIITKTRAVGLLQLDSATPLFFNETHAQGLKAFADQAAVAIENASLFEEVQRLATVDPLTALFNRRHFFELAAKEIDRSQRYGVRLAVILMDVDRFKNVNDTHGHQVGDQVLGSIAKVCRESVREVDVLARYGGEEFVCLLPETGLAEAQTTAERVRLRVAEMRVGVGERGAGGDLSVTMSLGVAALLGGQDTLDRMLLRADEALYAAKAAGRDRVVVWKQPPNSPPSVR